MQFVPLAEPERLAEQIAELSLRIDVAECELLGLILRFEQCGEWAHQGARSMAHWLTWRCGMGLRAAQERARIARALPGLPKIAAALRGGEVSFSKVRAMTRVATPANEAELLDRAIHSTGSQLERICRAYRNVLRGADDKPENDRWNDADRRFLRSRSGPMGMVRIEIQLPPEEAQIVLETVNSLAKPEPRAESNQVEDGTSADAASPARPGRPAPEPRSAERSDRGYHERHIRERRLADALVGIFEGVRREAPKLSGGTVHEIMVHTTLEALRRKPGEGPAGTLEDGTLLDPTTMRRLSSEAAVVFVRRGDDGEVLDVGRATRTIPPALRRALRIRDGGCRFPGCDCHRHVDAHHVKHWVDGGETSLDNLITLCRFHHRAVHERGFSVSAEGDDFVFRDRHGELIERVPRRPLHAGDFEPLRWPPAVGVNRLDPHGVLPRWNGDGLNLDWAVDSLFQADARPHAHLDAHPDT